MERKFLILDVEGFSTCRPYNIGYIVGDKKGKIYFKKNFAVLPCIWENLKNCMQAKEMTHQNVQEILSDIEKINARKYEYVNVEEMKKEILKTIEEYNIKEIWAYNAPFDKSSIKRLFGKDWENLNKIVTFYDIIPAIVFTKLLNKSYIEWCNRNKFITQKGNVQTKAEIVYKYLFDNLDFEEEHTALEDCKIEYHILLAAIHTGKEIGKEKNTPAWKIFKNFCETEGIHTIIPEN